MRGFLGLRPGRAERACAEPASNDAPGPCAPPILPAPPRPARRPNFPARCANLHLRTDNWCRCEGEGSGIGRESCEGQVVRRMTSGAHGIAPDAVCQTRAHEPPPGQTRRRRRRLPRHAPRVRRAVGAADRRAQPAAALTRPGRARRVRWVSGRRWATSARARREGLDPQDPAARGHRAVDPGDDDAGQGEHGEGVAVLLGPDQREHQAGDEEPVVEPLVGGEHLGLRRRARGWCRTRPGRAGCPTAPSRARRCRRG